MPKFPPTKNWSPKKECFFYGIFKGKIYDFRYNEDFLAEAGLNVNIRDILYKLIYDIWIACDARPYILKNYDDQ